MDRKTLSVFVVAYCLIISSLSVNALDIVEIENPPGANVIHVGDLIQNGLPLQIKQFTVKNSIIEVFAFYKQRWSDTRNYDENVPNYIEKQVGEWHILSKMHKHYSVVVQAKTADSNITEGFISVSDLSQKTEDSQLTLSFPKLIDSKLLSTTESTDSGRRATTLMIINNHSIEDNNRFYRSSMDEQGWSYKRGSIRDNVAMLHFAKQTQQCEIAITQGDDGKTVIFVNVVESNENS
ncbi:MAG: hypothetical protein JAY90_11985 [Candidatus Thiodiazotropha lotti]|nr:hypothetical protein [Candidatus Thiodiazotropha lotti]